MRIGSNPTSSHLSNCDAAWRRRKLEGEIEAEQRAWVTEELAYMLCGGEACKLREIKRIANDVARQVKFALLTPAKLVCIAQAHRHHLGSRSR